MLAVPSSGCALSRIPGRTADAIRYFEAALRLQPDDPTGQAGLADARYALHMTNGLAALSRKNYSTAADEFDAALKAKPNDPVATNALNQAKQLQLVNKTN